MFLCLAYCKQCCYEHGGAPIFSNSQVKTICYSLRGPVNGSRAGHQSQGIKGCLLSSSHKNWGRRFVRKLLLGRHWPHVERSKAEGEHKASTCPLRFLERNYQRPLDECLIKSLPLGCSCEDKLIGLFHVGTDASGCTSLPCVVGSGWVRTPTPLVTALGDLGAQALLATRDRRARVVTGKTRVPD